MDSFLIVVAVTAFVVSLAWDYYQWWLRVPRRLKEWGILDCHFTKN
jgi:hypothetical protein